MDKIQGFSNNYNLNFNGLFNRQPKDDKIIFLDTHLLDYGIPKKVAFVKDHDYEFTTVKLFDKKNECFYSEEMSDEDAEDSKLLFIKNGVRDFVDIEDIKGGLYGKPKRTRVVSKNAITLDRLGSKEKAQIMAALIKADQRERAAKTQLDAPAILRTPDFGYSMGYYSFLAETMDSGFDIDKVLNNLNISTEGCFEPENIERITVSPDGTKMRIQTKDSKSASLDFCDGARRVFDTSYDNSGCGTIMIMDKNGPILKPASDKRH